MAALRAQAARLHRRTYLPFAFCDKVCDQAPPVCMYRHAVADVIATGQYAAAWSQADAADAAETDDQRHRTWKASLDAAYAVIQFPAEGASADGAGWSEEQRAAAASAAGRVAGCYAQQMLARDPSVSPATARFVMEKLWKPA